MPGYPMDPYHEITQTAYIRHGSLPGSGGFQGMLQIYIDCGIPFLRMKQRTSLHVLALALALGEQKLSSSKA